MGVGVVGAQRPLEVGEGPLEQRDRLHRGAPPTGRRRRGGGARSGCRGGRRPAPARSRRGSARTARSPPRGAPPTGRRRRGGGARSGCRGGRRPAPARSRRGSARTARSPPRSAPPTGRRRRGRGGRPRVSGWSAPSTSSLSVATRSPRSMALVRSAARSCRRQGYPRATGAALLLSIETTANVRTRVIQGGVFVQL